MGNLVEWYDWFAYAAFAIYFAPVFFPQADPTAQLLNSAAIFAVRLCHASDRRVGDGAFRRYARAQGGAVAVAWR